MNSITWASICRSILGHHEQGCCKLTFLLFAQKLLKMCCTNEVIEKMNLPLSSKDLFRSMIVWFLPHGPLRHLYERECLLERTGDFREASFLTWTWRRKVTLFINTFAPIFVCFLLLLTGSFKCSSSSGLARSLSTRVQFCHSDSTPAHIRNEVALKAAAALASSSMLVV